MGTRSNRLTEAVLHVRTRTASVPQSMFRQKFENYFNFSHENYIKIFFIAVKYCSILHGRVCVMGCNVGSLWDQLFMFLALLLLCVT